MNPRWAETEKEIEGPEREKEKCQVENGFTETKGGVGVSMVLMENSAQSLSTIKTKKYILYLEYIVIGSRFWKQLWWYGRWEWKPDFQGWKSEWQVRRSGWEMMPITGWRWEEGKDSQTDNTGFRMIFRFWLKYGRNSHVCVMLMKSYQLWRSRGYRDLRSLPRFYKYLLFRGLSKQQSRQAKFTQTQS